jgi:predicted RNase H-like HicB family nuclease
MMQSYPIEVFWSSEDGVWIVDVPDLAFCTGHGSTPHEAVPQVEVAVDAWLDAARLEGRRIPTPSLRSLRA